MPLNYNNQNVRRQDRLLELALASELLEVAEYGVLSLVAENEAYGIPLNFVWDKKTSIFFHCAFEGKKLECLKKNNNVSFCIVGKTNVISNQFTTEYESIIISGKMVINVEKKEKQQALELILDKYSASDKEIGLQYMEKSFHRTNIIRLDIETISGKCKHIKK